MDKEKFRLTFLLYTFFIYTIALASPKLRNPQFHDQGFWGNGPSPTLHRTPRIYFPQTDHLAALSPGCADLRPAAPQSCIAYKETDLLLSFNDALSNQEVARAQVEHPWNTDSLRSNLRPIRLRSLQGLSDLVRELLRGCRVVRYVFISAHGAQAQVHFAGVAEGVTPFEVLAQSRMACVLVPDARIQFDSCHQACRWIDQQRNARNGAREIEEGLRQIFSDPLLVDRGISTQRDLRFLFHTGEGQVSHTEPRQYFDWLYNRLGIHDPDGNGFYLTLEDENNLGVMFQVTAGQVRTDAPNLDQMPQCR